MKTTDAPIVPPEYRVQNVSDRFMKGDGALEIGLFPDARVHGGTRRARVHGRAPTLMARHTMAISGARPVDP